MALSVSGGEDAPRDPAAPLKRLAAELRDEGSVIAPRVLTEAEIAGPAALGALIAAGPRAQSNPGDYALVIECVREGYLLHYGQSRILASDDDPDLALLAGDYLYAKGLERLAGLGDLDAVGELSDLISLTAQLNASGGEPDGPAAGVAWLAATVAIATGGGRQHERAKATLRVTGDTRPLWDVAREAATLAGLGEPLIAAAEAVGFRHPDRG